MYSDKLRRNYIIKLMEKYNINFELITVTKLEQSQYYIIGNNKISIGEAGCYLSHMYCLYDAIKHNYDNIINLTNIYKIIKYLFFRRKFNNHFISI